MINVMRRRIYLKRISVLLYIAVLFFTMLPLSPVVSATNSEGRKIMVSLGDSFSSGESIEPFYGQDEKKVAEKVKNHDWLAHRSQDSWPGMLTLPGVEGKMADHHDKNDNWYS